MGRIFILSTFQTEKGFDLRGEEGLNCGGNVVLSLSYDGAESMVIFEQWVQLNETLPDHCKPTSRKYIHRCSVLDAIKDNFWIQILIAVCSLFVACYTSFAIIRMYMIGQNLRLKNQ